jgi:hypothetical protein
MFARHVLFLILALACAGRLGADDTGTKTAPASNWTTVFTDTLTASGAWSDADVTKTPDVGTIRGPFHAQTVQLSLHDLPDHHWLRIRCHLYVRGTWDGSHPIWGPDIWSLTLKNGRRLIFATICNEGEWAGNNSQSYPDDYSVAISHPARTGAVGKLADLDSFDSVHKGLYTTYPIEVVLPHAKPTVDIDFAGVYDDPEEEQAWGIDQVVVETATSAPTNPSALPHLWKDLADPDAAKANQALWEFVGAGEPAITYLEDRLDAMKSGIEEAPKSAVGDRQAQLTLRVRRANRILRILGGADVGDIRFGFDQLLPEY